MRKLGSDLLGTARSVPNRGAPKARAAMLLCLLCVGQLSAEEVTIEHDGLTLNGSLEMAEGKDFSDGMVLILHGIWGHNKMEVVESSQQALLATDRSSLAINLSLGIDNRHGFYDCAIDHRHQQKEALDEITAWIAWLKSQGVERIVLLGHSRGANQMMVHVVERNPANVTHLLMLAPGTHGTFGSLFVQRYGDHLDAALKQATFLAANGRGEELMVDTDFIMCPKARVTANAFLSYYSTQADARFQNFSAYLPRLTIPTLVISGTQDERQPNIRQDVAPFVDGESIHLSVIEGAGHFFLDFNIEEAMEAAVAFIEENE